MKDILPNILMLSFLILFIVGSFMYLDYSMTKNREGNPRKEKEVKPPQHF